MLLYWIELNCILISFIEFSFNYLWERERAIRYVISLFQRDSVYLSIVVLWSILHTCLCLCFIIVSCDNISCIIYLFLSFCYEQWNALYFLKLSTNIILYIYLWFQLLFMYMYILSICFDIFSVLDRKHYL